MSLMCNAGDCALKSLYSCAVGAVAACANILLHHALDFEDFAALDNTRIDVEQIDELIFVVAVAIFFMPAVEEYIFRKRLYIFLASRFGVRWSLITTSLVFTAAHLLALPLSALVGVFFFAFAAQLVYIRHRSLLLTISMHASFNAVALLLWSSKELLFRVAMSIENASSLVVQGVMFLTAILLFITATFGANRLLLTQK